MDILCCDPLDDQDSRSNEDSLTCSTDEGILECDYDTQVTKLYHFIEERQWDDVLYFLENGKWYSNSIFSAFQDHGERPSVQARTWVTALDQSGNVRWCQLPLHAAVTFLAPFTVISKLVEAYPKSVRCADDQDMLPLHYAFRFGAEDNILLLLLQKFPQAIGKKAVKDRLPLDLAQYGPRPEVGRIIDYYMQRAVRNAKTEWEEGYENTVKAMKVEANTQMEHELNLKNDKLVDALSELARTRKELADLKKQIRHNNQRDAAIESANSSIRSAKSNGVKRVSSLKSSNHKKTSTRQSDENTTSVTASPSSNQQGSNVTSSNNNNDSHSNSKNANTDTHSNSVEETESLPAGKSRGRSRRPQNQKVDDASGAASSSAAANSSNRRGGLSWLMRNRK